MVGTREFIDCDGNTIGVDDLSPPDSGVFPVVENQRVLYIDLAGVTTTADQPPFARQFGWTVHPNLRTNGMGSRRPTFADNSGGAAHPNPHTNEMGR